MERIFSCCSGSVQLSSFKQGVQVRILLINSNTQKSATYCNRQSVSFHAISYSTLEGLSYRFSATSKAFDLVTMIY